MKARCSINLGVSQCSQEAVPSKNTSALRTNEFNLVYRVKATKLEKSKIETLSHSRTFENYNISWRSPDFDMAKIVLSLFG